MTSLRTSLCSSLVPDRCAVGQSAKPVGRRTSTGAECRSHNEEEVFVERCDGHMVRVMVKPSDRIRSIKETIAAMLNVAPKRQLLTSWNGVQIDVNFERISSGQRLRIPMWRDFELSPGSTLFLTDFTELRSSSKPIPRIDKPELRGVTLLQLRQFLAFLKKRRHMKRGGILAGWCERDASSSSYQKVLTYESFNHHHAGHYVIRPATASEKCSCVEFLAPSREAVLRPFWFVSHAWSGETVSEFVECLEIHAATRSLSKTTASFWASVFCNNQQELGMELQADLLSCSFFRAIARVDGVLFLTGKDALATTRTWCCVEIYAALMADTKRKAPLLLDIATVVAEGHLAAGRVALLTDRLTRNEQEEETKMGRGFGWRQKAEREAAFPIEVMQLALSTDVRNSSASFSLDRLRLLKAVVPIHRKHSDVELSLESRDYDRVNSQIRSAFAALGLGNALTRSSHDRSLVTPFMNALREDKHRRSMHLNLTMCGAETGALLAEAAQSVSVGFVEVYVQMMQCSGFSCAGLSEFIEALPASLTTFSLNISGCRHIGDRWLAELGKAFQEDGQLKGLKRLELVLQSTRISDAELEMLGERFPPGLEMLEINLGKPIAAEAESYISDKGLGRLVRLLPPDLMKLKLDLSNTNVTGIGIEDLAVNLPRSLTMLKLNTVGTYADPGISIHAESSQALMQWRSDIKSRRTEDLNAEGPMICLSSSPPIEEYTNVNENRGTCVQPDLLALSTRRCNIPEPVSFRMLKTVRRQTTVEIALPIALEESVESVETPPRASSGSSLWPEADSQTRQEDDVCIQSLSERYVASLLYTCRDVAASSLITKDLSQRYVASLLCTCRDVVMAASRNEDSKNCWNEKHQEHVLHSGQDRADLDVMPEFGDSQRVPLDEDVDCEIFPDDVSDFPKDKAADAIVPYKPGETLDMPCFIPLSKFHCSGFGVRSRMMTPSTRSSTPVSAPVSSRPSSAPARSCRPRPRSAISQRQRPHSAVQNRTPFAQRPSSAHSSAPSVQRPTSAAPSYPNPRKGRLLQEAVAGQSNRSTTSLEQLERIRLERIRDMAAIPHDHDLERWCQEMKASSRFLRLDAKQLAPDYGNHLKFFYKGRRTCHIQSYLPGDVQELSSRLQSSTYALTHHSQEGARSDNIGGPRSKRAEIDPEAVERLRALKRSITKQYDELQPMDQMVVWGALCKNTIKERQLTYTSADIECLTDVANSLELSADDAMLCRAVFDGFDVGKKGYISKQEFEAVVVQLLGLQFPNQVVPLSHAKSACREFWERRGVGLSDNLVFEEFAAWYSDVLHNNFLVTESQRLVDIAVEYSIGFEFVDSLKRCYDSFCNEAGILDFDQFAKLLPKIMKVPPELELPQHRVKYFWNDLDPKSSDGIVFEQFLRWWLACFYDGDENSETPPYENHYKMIRSVHLRN